MNRNELINKINDLFDEVVNLKIRNEYLEFLQKDNTVKEIREKPQLLELDKKMSEYGKSVLYEKVITHRYVRVEEGNNGDLACEKFESWVENAISKYYIPDSFSKDDIINIFSNELHEIYSKKKAEAIQEFEKERAKNG